MKHLFIFNGLSLKKQSEKELTTQIKTVCTDQDFEIFISKTATDGYEKAAAAAASGEEICIYAVGGDGTVHQIAEAIYGHPNASLSALPIGTGNDFVRNFALKKDFLSLSQVTDGITKSVDMIDLGTQKCINMINIGFDESVVSRVASLRRFPLMSKSIAYTIGVIIQLIRFPQEELCITFEDGTCYKGKCLLTYVANGKFCGGGYKAASRAETDDGMMDVMIVRPVSRLQFIRMVGKYKKGTLIDSPQCEKFAVVKQTRHLTIKKDTPFHYCLDGEIFSAEKLSLSILPKCIRFTYPKEDKI